ncbi:hypothetical protein [Fundidesulfovibrio soli]|uniref:hypothetical protein n=1 Tax=Fundidesulfovibrio soli TaxID=2922716 RepID=UPI001FAF8AEB|nr:hypothetical protein [Fundidesulfovibrio soli]
MSERIDDPNFSDYSWLDDEKRLHDASETPAPQPSTSVEQADSSTGQSYPKFESPKPEIPWEHAPIGAEPYPTILEGRADSPFNRLPPAMRAGLAGRAAGFVAGKIPIVGGWLSNGVIAPAAIQFYQEDTKTPELPPRE